MELRDYLHFSRKTVTEFAKELQLSRSYITQLVSGKRKASRLVAKHIQEITGGEVTAEEVSQGNYVEQRAHIGKKYARKTKATPQILKETLGNFLFYLHEASEGGTKRLDELELIINEYVEKIVK